MRKFAKTVFQFFRRAYTEWDRTYPNFLAAGLGYFSLFSLIPFLVLITAAVGFFWAHQDSQLLIRELRSLFGRELASSFEAWLPLAASYGKTQASLVSFVVLLWSASKVFSQVRTALDIIWDVKPQTSSFVKDILTTALMNFAMLGGVLLFLFSFVLLDAVVAFLIRALGNYVFGLKLVLTVANVAIPPGLFTLLFAAAYKYIPDTPVKWRDVWLGAIVTAVVMAIGKVLIGLYLRWQPFDSLYGTASSFIVLLGWIYFAAQIFFFGAHITRQYALTYGSHAPKKSTA